MKYEEFVDELHLIDKEQWESLILANAEMLVEALDNKSRSQADKELPMPRTMINYLYTLARSAKIFRHSIASHSYTKHIIRKG